MPRPTLNLQQLQHHLTQLPGWQVENEKLHREYEFADFAHAIGFISTAAILIEKINHHPEWSNVYNRVIVDLTTHDSGGITTKDIELARLLDEVASQ